MNMMVQSFNSFSACVCNLDSSTQMTQSRSSTKQPIISIISHHSPIISQYIMLYPQPCHTFLFFLVFAHVLKPRGIFLLVKSPHFRLNHCDRLPISAEIPWIFWWNIMFFSGDRWYLHFCWWHLQFLMGKSHFFAGAISKFCRTYLFARHLLGQGPVADDLGSLAIAWGLHTSAFFHDAQDLGGRAHHLRPAANRWDPLNRVAIEIYPNNGATWRSESEVKMFSLLRDLFNFSGYHLATMGWGHPSWPIPIWCWKQGEEWQLTTGFSYDLRWLQIQPNKLGMLWACVVFTQLCNPTAGSRVPGFQGAVLIFTLGEKRRTTPRPRDRNP